VVVEEAPPQRARRRGSGGSVAAIGAYGNGVAGGDEEPARHLGEEEKAELADVAYTLQVGGGSLAVAGGVGGSREETVALLEAGVAGRQRGRPVSTGTSRNSDSASAVANTCPVPWCLTCSVSAPSPANTELDAILARRQIVPQREPEVTGHRRRVEIRHDRQHDAGDASLRTMNPPDSVLSSCTSRAASPGNSLLKASRSGQSWREARR